MRELLKLKEDLGAEAMTVCVAGGHIRVTVTAKRQAYVAQRWDCTATEIELFNGDPWILPREGLRDFATANAHADLPAVAGKVRRVVGNSGVSE